MCCFPWNPALWAVMVWVRAAWGCHGVLLTPQDSLLFLPTMQTWMVLGLFLTITSKVTTLLSWEGQVYTFLGWKVTFLDHAISQWELRHWSSPAGTGGQTLEQLTVNWLKLYVRDSLNFNYTQLKIGIFIFQSSYFKIHTEKRKSREIT